MAFAAAGIANLVGIGTIRSDFARWGYPPGFHRITGAFEIAGAAALLHPYTRILGTILLAVTMAAAIVTLLRHREGAVHLAVACGLGFGLIALVVIS